MDNKIIISFPRKSRTYPGTFNGYNFIAELVLVYKQFFCLEVEVTFTLENRGNFISDLPTLFYNGKQIPKENIFEFLNSLLGLNNDGFVDEMFLVNQVQEMLLTEVQGYVDGYFVNSNKSSLNFIFKFLQFVSRPFDTLYSYRRTRKLLRCSEKRDSCGTKVEFIDKIAEFNNIIEEVLSKFFEEENYFESLKSRPITAVEMLFFTYYKLQLRLFHKKTKYFKNKGKLQTILYDYLIEYKANNALPLNNIKLNETRVAHYSNAKEYKVSKINSDFWYKTRAVLLTGLFFMFLWTNIKK